MLPRNVTCGRFPRPEGRLTWAYHGHPPLSLVLTAAGVNLAEQNFPTLTSAAPAAG
jgi:hypothetical protein